jgi:hypothetical protein
MGAMEIISQLIWFGTVLQWGIVLGINEPIETIYLIWYSTLKKDNDFVM